MRRILSVDYYKLGVFLDMDCSDHDKILHEFTRNKLLYNESYYWLLITKEEAPINLLEKLHLAVNTEMTLALQNTENILLYDVYNPSFRHGGKLNVTFMGTWQSHDGLKIDFDQYKYERRRNLNGLQLNFSIFLSQEPKPDLMTYLSVPENTHLDSMHRYHFNLIRQLKDMYNFSIHLTQGTNWGYLVNGTYTGIMGDMAKGIVDIGATPFMFLKDRLDICEFTVQSYVAKGGLMFRHPKKNNIRNSFLKPFEEKVWWLMIMTMILIWILIIITAKMEQKYNADFKMKKPLVALDGALDVMGSTCLQDCFEIPRFYSGRIVYITLFVWGFLMSQYYSASIVGSLLAEPTRFINTIEDLANSDLEVGVEDVGYIRNFFATTNDQHVINLYNKKIAPNKKRKTANYLKAHDGLQRVKKGGFAFQIESATAYKIVDDTFTEEEICELVVILMVPTESLATATVKNSPFKKMVTYGLRQIVEHGNAEKLKRIWQYKKPTCPESFSSIPTPVVLTDFFPLIFLISTASGLAVFIMILENVMRKIHYK
ncbi:ionotropic receptor 75a-like isoform X1 [Leptopilina heterotoma]|uniref:ionotropic receptor 75a-like isoform X1 n=1 Tax=Leptopilina heterotoma TaxID=63436 RepID=UPI001CAA1A13|nr:ionotropic receptor 75a-like isoform X1 [Leptopilina heterotoma]